MKTGNFTSIKQKSIIPIYMVAALWVIYGLLAPLYKLSHIIIASILSFVVYLIGNIIFPAKQFDIPTPKAAEKVAKAYEPNTGNSDTDKIIKDGFAAITHLKDINARINDEILTIKINRMEAAAKSIFDAITDKPKKIGSIKKFMNYYLPTAIKLLESYDRLSKSGASGENVSSTLTSVENSMDMIVTAFEKQLDNLYADEALDISTDIDVLETILKSEGLKENEFDKK